MKGLLRKTSKLKIPEIFFEKFAIITDKIDRRYYFSVFFKDCLRLPYHKIMPYHIFFYLAKKIY